MINKNIINSAKKKKMDTGNNVLSFPRKNIRVQTLEQVDEVMTNAQMRHVEQAVEFVAPILFEYLCQAGFDFSNSTDELEKADIKQAAFILEAIRSVLSMKYGIEHPFQELANVAFTDLEDGGFKLADSVNITFKKMKIKQH